MAKSAEAFRTISEVADWLGVQTHVLRFWESKFTQVKPVKRAGGRRYYRPNDMALLAGIRVLLHDDGVTIRGVQKILREKGIKHVVGLNDRPLAGMEDETGADDAPEVSAPEPEPAKVIPMQPTGNVSNLFGNDEAQQTEKEEESEESEPLTLFSHRAEPEVESISLEPEPEPDSDPEPVAEDPVPSFSRSMPEAPEEKEEPAAVAEASETEVSAAAETPTAPSVEMPVASPVAGPALAAAAAAAAKLAPESIISRADRLAPTARRLQDLHARMSGEAG